MSANEPSYTNHRVLNIGTKVSIPFGMTKYYSTYLNDKRM